MRISWPNTALFQTVYPVTHAKSPRVKSSRNASPALLHLRAIRTYTHSYPHACSLCLCPSNEYHAAWTDGYGRH